MLRIFENSSSFLEEPEDIIPPPAYITGLLAALIIDIILAMPGVGRLGGRADSGEVGLGFKIGREHLLLNVLGNVYHYGPGPAALGYYKGFLYYSGQVFGVEDEIAVLDYRQRHAEHVGFLEGALADERLEDPGRLSPPSGRCP